GVATEHGEHLVVADLLQHVERVRAAFEERHLLETGAPGAVVPEHGVDRQAVANRGLDVESADAEPAIPDHQHHRLARTRKLRADGHADAVADRCQWSRIYDLAREARAEPLSHPPRQREAVDDDGGVAIEHAAKLATEPVRMDRRLIVRFLL